MRIKLHFNQNVLKNAKAALQILYKLYETIQPKPIVYFIYYNKKQSLRFLFSSQTFPAVISIAAQALSTPKQWCKLNENIDITSIQILDCMDFLESFLQILSRDDTNGIVLEVKKQKMIRFVKLNFHEKQLLFHLKIAVNAPKYDAQQVKLHQWINGCLNSEMDFWIQTEPLLCIMRVFAKMRQKQQSSKKLQIKFNFIKNQYVSLITGGNKTFEGQCNGTLKAQNKQRKYKSVTYYINVQNSKIALETVKKCKQLKLMMSQQKQLIFVYNKENVYVCQLRVSEWIKLKCFEPEQNYGNEMKIQAFE